MISSEYLFEAFEWSHHTAKTIREMLKLTDVKRFALESIFSSASAAEIVTDIERFAVSSLSLIVDLRTATLYGEIA